MQRNIWTRENNQHRKHTWNKKPLQKSVIACSNINSNPLKWNAHIILLINIDIIKHLPTYFSSLCFQFLKTFFLICYRTNSLDCCRFAAKFRKKKKPPISCCLYLWCGREFCHLLYFVRSGKKNIPVLAFPILWSQLQEGHRWNILTWEINCDRGEKQQHIERKHREHKGKDKDLKK